MNNKIYYVRKNKQYYNRLYGWVDHRKFADKLTYEEAQVLIKYYTEENLKIAI